MVGQIWRKLNHKKRSKTFLNALNKNLLLLNLKDFLQKIINLVALL